MNDLLNATNALPELGSAEAAPTKRNRRKPTKKAKPKHYKVICISMYTSDLDQLGASVAELKRRGLTRMSKSKLIRVALRRLDIAALAA